MSSRPHRKLWVCEPGSTATSVPVNSGELVDDVKTLVLSRYANSLKAVDAANMTITIKPRPQGPPACYERYLSPDEDVFQLLDSYYPGGQKLVEALIISSAPRPKRNTSLADSHKQRSVPARAPINWPPFDDFNEPATPVRGLGLTIREIQATPQQPGSSRKGLQQSGLMRSKSAGNSSTHLRADSGKFERSARDLFNPVRNSPSPQPVRRDSSPSDRASSRKPFARRNPSAQSARIRRPSPEDRAPSSYFAPAPQATTQGSRPGSRIGRPLTTRPPNIRPTTLTTSEKPPKQLKPSSKPRRSKSRVQLDGAIPPINVLIAEDNSLVSRVVSKQMQQLNVRWDTAANGLEAVNKWKAGKFHLIFMDIGMPVMDGLAATKEIRRLERGGGEIKDDQDGTGTATAAEAPPQQRGPVIIVALTASSLPADRDSALNAGCNDFITKPLEQAWLQQKVKEWGCMQALINHEDWRIWRAYATQS
jgi:osomolarity two-component system response regulator SSK1